MPVIPTYSISLSAESSHLKEIAPSKSLTAGLALFLVLIVGPSLAPASVDVSVYHQ